MSNFEQLTDGTDQNIGNIEDSVVEFFARVERLFEKVKRREFGIGRRESLPKYKHVEFPLWLYKGVVDDATGDPKVISLLIPAYPDDKDERGYALQNSGHKKSCAERDRKMELGYCPLPSQAQVDAENAAIAFRKREMQTEEEAKLDAVQAVWGRQGRVTAQTDEALMVGKLMAQLEAMQQRIEAMEAAKPDMPTEIEGIGPVARHGKPGRPVSVVSVDNSKQAAG